MALSLPNRKVVVLDGDGAFLMNLCGLPTIARQAPPNLIHVLFDNRVYEASGSIPTATSVVGDAVDLAKGAGYPNACWVKNPEEFRAEFVKAWERNQLSFIGARVEPGTPSGLPRISVDEIENKYRFIRHVEATEKKTILGSPDHSRR
jgi:phosphonopyruvate decarboxylase